MTSYKSKTFKLNSWPLELTACNGFVWDKLHHFLRSFWNGSVNHNWPNIKSRRQLMKPRNPAPRFPKHLCTLLPHLTHTPTQTHYQQNQQMVWRPSFRAAIFKESCTCVKCMAIATRIMFVNLCTDCCCSLAATTEINKRLLDHIFKHALNPEGHYLGIGFGKIGARRWQPCSALRGLLAMLATENAERTCPACAWQLWGA